MKVIAFSGRARCGKSYITQTLARHLWDSGDYIPVVLPLAAPLKEAAAEAGFPKETHPQEYRTYCQETGAAMREADPDHWLRLWHDMFLDAMMRELGHSSEFVVIVDDVRYENELEFINNMANSKTIFVTEGTRSGTLEDDSAEWREHHSEYLANDARDNWEEYEDRFDFLFSNDQEAYEDLLAYISMGDGLGKVTEAWLGNHKCECALCKAFISNTDVDEEELTAKLNEIFGSDLGLAVEGVIDDIDGVDEIIEIEPLDPSEDIEPYDLEDDVDDSDPTD